MDREKLMQALAIIDGQLQLAKNYKDYWESSNLTVPGDVETAIDWLTVARSSLMFTLKIKDTDV